MKTIMLCALACTACIEPLDELATSSTEAAVWDGGGEDPNGEVVRIEGTWDACLDGGVCWDGLDENPIDWGDTGGGGGGGGGLDCDNDNGNGNEAEPYDEWMRIPKGQDCARYLGWQDCMDCCARNLEKVWWPYCDKKGHKKTACKKHVGTYTYPGCIRSCTGKPGDPGNPICGAGQ